MQTEFTLSLVALCGQNVSLGCGIHYSYAALAALRIGNNLKEGKIATVVQHSTAQHTARRGAQRIRIPQLHLPAVRTQYLPLPSPSCTPCSSLGPFVIFAFTYGYDF